MRFSLGTLILVVLWLGSVVFVWRQREPWVRFTPRKSVCYGTTDSPDQTRRILIRHVDEFPDRVVIEQNSGDDTGRELWQKEGNFLNAFFVDDNTMCLATYDEPTDDLAAYHRRFPEWWWGHFYRPEMWSALALTAVLLVRTVRNLRVSLRRFQPIYRDCDP